MGAADGSSDGSSVGESVVGVKVGDTGVANEEKARLEPTCFWAKIIGYGSTQLHCRNLPVGKFVGDALGVVVGYAEGKSVLKKANSSVSDPGQTKR